MARAVGASKVLQEDGGVIFADSSMSATDRPRCVGVGEINLGCDPFAQAGPTNQILVVTKGIFLSLSARELSEGQRLSSRSGGRHVLGRCRLR